MTQVNGLEQKTNNRSAILKNRLSGGGRVTWSPSLRFDERAGERREGRQKEAEAQFFSRGFLRKKFRLIFEKDLAKRRGTDTVLPPFD
jgi:hypothetical protein